MAILAKIKTQLAVKVFAQSVFRGDKLITKTSFTKQSIMNFNSIKFIIFLTAAISLISAILVYIFLKFFVSPPVSFEERYVSFCDDNSCHKTNIPYQSAELSIGDRVNDLLNRMTIAEKIGQMALIEKNSISEPNDIAKYGLGALMSGGGAKPENNTPEDWLRMVDNFQNYSKKTRLGIPVLYGVDANHGHTNVPGATIFPHSIGLGATGDAAMIKKVAEATAREVAATGINWIYSPDLDVVQDTRWGRTYETFGSDPLLVGALGQAYIEGVQSFSRNGIKTAAAAKHYIGNGSSEWGSSINNNFFIDQGNSKIKEDQLRQIHLYPFKQAVEADVKTIMAGLNKWNGEKIVFNDYLINDVLKNELGFQGFVFSDWYGVFEEEENKYEALVKAVNAGVDMIMLPYDYKFFSESMRQALAKGDISAARLNDAVRRILKVKFEMGLFERAVSSSDDLKNIGSMEHRDLAREAVRKSLVLLKNKNTVPIPRNTPKILVAGSAADNIGKQSGGWTVEWQGIDGNWIPGTTILKGIQKLASPNTKIEYDPRGDFADLEQLADIGIAIVGENPYAEGWGDNKNPKLAEEDVEVIYRLKKASKKVIAIVISGRPLSIKEFANDCDVIIAAWLPGSEGQGVADVLFGDYPFTGVLPVAWDL